MTSKQYWKTRSILLEQLLHDRSEATAQRISRLYGLAQERIFQRIEKVFSAYVKGGALTEAEALRLLSVRETEEAEAALRRLYETAKGPAKRAIWARLSAPAYSFRISRLQALRDELYAQARMVGLEEVSYVRDRLSDTLEQSYYRTTFDIQHFTGEYYDFDRLTDRQVKAALAADWNGKNWSSRIWDNNQLFADAVEDTVTVGIMTGQRYDEMRDNLMHVIGLDDTEGARYRSARLVQTECAYVANHGHLMGYEAAGIDRYIFLATLDMRTSEICRSLDGKRFPVNEAQPGTNYPPMHPWCRSTTMPDMSAEQLRKVKRAARDPKTGKSITVPGDMTYQEWYRKFEEGHPQRKGAARPKKKGEKAQKLLAKSGESGILKSKGQSAGGIQKPAGDEPKRVGLIESPDKETVVSKMEEVEERLVQSPVEMNCTVTGSGEIWLTRGSAGAVHPEQITDLHGISLQGSYSYHNHPERETHYSFSADDVAFFFEHRQQWSMASDRLYKYVMERLAETKQVTWQEARTLFQDGYAIAREKAFFKEPGFDIDRDGFHVAMEHVSRVLQFRYERVRKNGE